MDQQINNKLESFFTQFKKQNYKKGEILIRADDDPSGIFYITNGTVRMYLITGKGDEIVLNMFKPVSFFPMSWAINDSQNNYFFEAMTEVTVWKAPKDEVLTFLKQNPEIVFDLLNRVYRGVDGLLSKMAYLMSGSAHARLITELIISAKRFGKTNENNEVVLTVSEKDLAAQTGLTRETVSRVMKVLKDKGLVSLKNSVLVIKNLSSLEDELNRS